MKRIAMVATILAAQLAWAQEPAKPAVLMSGLGDLHHPVSTKNPQAQQFFDQGLRLIYAFNHDEAARSFRRAAELDPKLAMAYWGSLKPLGRITTIRPATTVLSKLTTPSRRQSISRTMRRLPSKPTFKPWRCVSPPIPRRIAGRRPRLITMPCARWPRTFPMTWMPPPCSPNQA